MNIAILTNDYPPQTQGGAGVVAALQVRGLERRGHAVKVVVSRPNLQGRRSVVRLFRHFLDLGARRDLVDEIVAWKPDVLITHNLTGCGFATPTQIVKKMKTRWIHVLHDVQLIEPSGQIVGIRVERPTWSVVGVWRLFWAFLRRRALGRLSVVVSPTRWLLDFHTAYGFFSGIESRIIPNPMPSLEVPSSSDAQEREGILYVGRLDRDKGVDVLVRAWQAMGSSRPTLTLIGDGSLRNELASLHDERLKCAGRLSNVDVLKLMQTHRVVCVPSLVWENQPTVILEGLATGCHVVASDGGGIPETLGRAGWIVPAGDAQALHDALKGALSARMSSDQEKERDRILLDHRPEVVVEALESLLRSKV